MDGRPGEVKVGRAGEYSDLPSIFIVAMASASRLLARRSRNLYFDAQTRSIRQFTAGFVVKDTDALQNRQHGAISHKKANDFSSVDGSAGKIRSFEVSGIEERRSGTTLQTISSISTPSVGKNGSWFFGARQGISRLSPQAARRYSSASGLPPHQQIGMPSLSPTMTEGNIAKWLKKEGDKISPGEVLCEVETDKATVEMECMEEGYLAKIIHGDGAKEIKVGEVIAITVEDEADVPKFKDYEVSSSPATSDAASVKESSDSSPLEKEDVQPASVPDTKGKVSEPSREDDRIFISPIAKKLAQDNNVPLSKLKGTGPEGRIVKADVDDYLARSSKETPAASKTAAATQMLEYSDIPHSQIRKITAYRLLFSKQSIPHYYLTVDVCVDKLVSLRTQLNSLQESSGGKKVSINDFVIKASALANRKVPECNSSWTDEYIRRYRNVNINVAVQTDNGLFVPVVRDADKKGLSAIAADVKHLAEKAKSNSLKPEDYEGGTFTVSNLGGPFGIKQFCAIINPPQAAILAVGSAEKRVVPGGVPDEYNVSSFMTVTLSCDHRVIDGAIGAEWLKTFKGYIEDPISMLL